MQDERCNMETERATTGKMTGDWRYFGVNAVAYVRPVQHEGEDAFGVFGADGTLLDVAASRELALTEIRQRRLHATPVH